MACYYMHLKCCEKSNGVLSITHFSMKLSGPVPVFVCVTNPKLREKGRKFLNVMFLQFILKQVLPLTFLCGVYTK